MPRYRVAREWRDYVIAIDVVSCHSIRMVKAGVVDASRASKRRARGALAFSFRSVLCTTALSAVRWPRFRPRHVCHMHVSDRKQEVHFCVMRRADIASAVCRSCLLPHLNVSYDCSQLEAISSPICGSQKRNKIYSNITLPITCAAQKACEQGHVHALEVMNQLKSVKRKRRSYTAGLRSFAGCFGTRTVNDAGCPHGRAAHAPPKYCCKVYAAFCLRGGVHIRATASMTRADKAIALDLERVDCNEASDCELLEVRATLISRSGLSPCLLCLADLRAHPRTCSAKSCPQTGIDSDLQQPQSAWMCCVHGPGFGLRPASAAQ